METVMPQEQQVANDDTNMMSMDVDMNMDVDAIAAGENGMIDESGCEDKKECQEIVELLLGDEPTNNSNGNSGNGPSPDAVNFMDMMVDPNTGGRETSSGRGCGSFRQVSDSTTGGGSAADGTNGGAVVMDPMNAFDDANLVYFDVDAEDIPGGDDDVNFGYYITSPSGVVVNGVDNGMATASTMPASADTANINNSSNIDDDDGFALTGRPGIPLYLSCNPDHLSLYQSEIRKHIQFFEATPVYVHSNEQVKGRNKAIVLGQVGIQCIHCANILPLSNRSKGNMYFPQKLIGVYQASQILATNHLLDSCQLIPKSTRLTLKEYQSRSQSTIASKSTGGGGNLVNSGGRTAGKEYWSKTAQALGVYEDEHGLRFKDRLPTYQEMMDKKKKEEEEKAKLAKPAVVDDDDDDDGDFGDDYDV